MGPTDSTHGTNRYNFNLITIVAIDENGEGFPVAWCISNRKERILLQIFYNEIKEKVGMLTPKWFMSDLADQYYSAWVAKVTMYLARCSSLERKSKKDVG